jgi:hypothetical protein
VPRKRPLDEILKNKSAVSQKARYKVEYEEKLENLLELGIGIDCNKSSFSRVFGAEADGSGSGIVDVR